MKLKNIPPFVWIIIVANLYWSSVVALSTLIYFSSSHDSMEGAGFLLVFAGLPSSMLVALFPQNISVGMQMFLMVLFGYMQWNILGLLVSIFFNKISKRN